MYGHTAVCPYTYVSEAEFPPLRQPDHLQRFRNCTPVSQCPVLHLGFRRMNFPDSRPKSARSMLSAHFHRALRTGCKSFVRRSARCLLLPARRFPRLGWFLFLLRRARGWFGFRSSNRSGTVLRNSRCSLLSSSRSPRCLRRSRFHSRTRKMPPPRWPRRWQKLASYRVFPGVTLRRRLRRVRCSVPVAGCGGSPGVAGGRKGSYGCVHRRCRCLINSASVGVSNRSSRSSAGSSASISSSGTGSSGRRLVRWRCRSERRFTADHLTLLKVCCDEPSGVVCRIAFPDYCACGAQSAVSDMRKCNLAPVH